MRHLTFALLVFVTAVAAQTASASQVISTSTATGLTLGINKQGQAFLSYMSRGKAVGDAGSKPVHVEVVAWGAVNALPPKQGGKQVAFQLDYSGGYTLVQADLATAIKRLRDDQSDLKAARAAELPTKYIVAINTAINTDYEVVHRINVEATNYGKTFRCPKYDGPPLAWEVAACDAPDGSYWAVQSWQRQLPDYGVTPTATQAAFEVHLSHWTGPLPVLTVSTDWSYHQWEHLFGTYTYDGSPVYGFASTAGGQPLDTWGRNVYLDSYASDYGGSGWQRVNSFLTHTHTGAWCYGVSPHGANNLTGKGLKYRLSIEGPGVTPDVMAEATSPGPYDQALDATANAAISAMHDNLCKPN
jgi:hypothetical protein